MKTFDRCLADKSHSLPLMFLKSPAGVPSLLTVGHEATGLLADTVANPTNAAASNLVKIAIL
jgi:hypothetical protein